MVTRLVGALYRRAESIKTDAQDNYVPVDDGNLKAEIKVFGPERKGTEISVSIAAGTGVSRSYALAVHEHPSRYDPPSWKGTDVVFSPEGRGPKYIEKRLLKAVRTLLRDIARDVRTGGS
jgi:hypothetical protein